MKFNKMKMRIIAAVVSTVALLGFTANGAWAFYTSGSCTTHGNVLNVTNYSKGSGQEYHWAVDADSLYYQIRVYVAGTKVATKYNAGEGYTFMANPTANYTVTAQFYARDADGGMASCSKVL